MYAYQQQQMLMMQQAAYMSQYGAYGMPAYDNQIDEPEDEAQLLEEFFYSIMGQATSHEQEIEQDIERIEKEKDLNDVDLFKPEFKDCECCKGYINKCGSPICHSLGVCQCMIRKEKEEENLQKNIYVHADS